MAGAEAPLLSMGTSTSPLVVLICSAFNSGPKQCVTLFSHGQWSSIGNRKPCVQSHSVAHLVFWESTCVSSSSAKMSPCTCKSLLSSLLPLFQNCIHLIHCASWVESSSFCFSHSCLSFSFLQSFCFIKQLLLHLSILPSGVLIMYECRTFVIHFTVSRPICLLLYTLYTNRITYRILNSGNSIFWMFSPQLWHDAAIGFAWLFSFKLFIVGKTTAIALIKTTLFKVKTTSKWLSFTFDSFCWGFFFYYYY